MIEKNERLDDISLMRVRVAFCGSVVLGIAVSPLNAEWIRLTTSHFEMYTTNPRAKAAEVLEILEDAHSFFDENSPSATVTGAPIRVVAFDSEKEFRPYSSNPGAVAFYQRARRDYIVMRDLGPDSYAIAIHEYTHLYLAHRNLHLPLWLNEGLADVYSTLQPKGSQLIVGLPPPGRLDAVRTLPLLDLRQLVMVDQGSQYYRDPTKMAQFYSESWALAHMLLLGKLYRDNFREFLSSVDQGKGIEASFRNVYGKSLSEVATDLRSYLLQREMTVSSFDTQLAQREIPTVSECSPQEAELVLADLLSTHLETADEAHARLTALAAESPSDPEVQKSLGYLAWRQGNVEEAAQHFKEAVHAGSTDALMIFHYAGLLEAAGAPRAEIVKLLERAVELKPDLYDARFNLGMEAASQGQCQIALSALSQIKTVQADRAYFLYSALAYCTWKTGDAADAGHWAELAKQYAGNAQQSATAEQLLEQLDRARK